MTRPAVPASSLALTLLAAAAAACGGGSPKKATAGDGSAGAHVAKVPVPDTEPDDDIEIQSSHGRMDPAVIETGLEPHKEDLGACYTSRVGKRTWLGGHVSIHWEIRKDGTVTAVKLAESDLGAWEIERCLLEIARAATFGKPIGGDAEFSLPLEFSLKGRLDVWEEDRALKAIGGQTASLDACDKAKGMKGAPPEDVTVTLYLGAGGKAQSVGFSSPKTVFDDAWIECAQKAALAWRLPDPGRGVAKLAIRYRAAQ